MRLLLHRKDLTSPATTGTVLPAWLAAERRVSEADGRRARQIDKVHISDDKNRL